jgi:anti-sigma B factor antagonist
MNTNPASNGESAGFPNSPWNILEVYETGQRLIVGFGRQSVADDHCLALYREQIRGLIKEHGATEVAFDLKAFKKIQSGTLGLIASVRNEGVKVYVFNVSPEVREVFELSNLDQVIEMRDPRKSA